MGGVASGQAEARLRPAWLAARRSASVAAFDDHAWRQSEADEDTLARVRDYEGRHRQRDTVLSATKPEVANQ
jgi:hypothetical protein